MKKILIIATSASILAYLALGAYFLFGNQEPILGAPASQSTRDLIPDNDSRRYIGTTTPSTNAYLGVITDELCLTGDVCRTTWPAGSASTPNLILSLIGGRSYLTASTTANSWYFHQGFVANASSTVNSQLNVSGVLNASSTGLFGTGLTVYSGNTVLAGGTTITCTGCLTDANVVDTITLTNITQITNRAISDTTGTLTVARGGTGLTTFGGTNTILYTSSADTLTSNSSFVFNGTNFGIGTTSPASTLSVHGASLTAGTSTVMGLYATSSIMLGSFSVTQDGLIAHSNFYGRSLSRNGYAIDADAELYTSMVSFNVSSTSMSTTTSVSQHKFATAVTITRISCSTDQGTSTVQFDARTEGTESTAGTDVLTSALSCGSGSDTNASVSFNDATIAADAPFNFRITDAAPNGTKPTRIRVHVDFTKDD